MSGKFAGYFLAGALPRLAMFIILFLLARALDPAETGLFVLVITVGELIEMTAGTWLRIYVLKEEAGRATMGPYRVGRLIALAVLMSAIALLLSFPISATVAPGRFWAFASAVLAYIAAFALLRHAQTLLQIQAAHTAFVTIEIIRAMTILAGATLGSSIWPASFLAPSLLLSAATAACALAGVIVAAPRLSRPRLTQAGLKPALLFGAPVVADTVLSLLIVHFDRFVLNQFLGPAAVGIYALAYALGRQPIEFIAGPLNTYTLPVLFAGYSNSGAERARQIQTGICITLFVLCAAIFTGMLLLAHPIANIALKEGYRAQAEWLMPTITFAACLLVFKAFVFDNVFHMVQKTQEKMPSVLLTAIFGISATLLLVWTFGIPGAAASLLLSSIFALSASVITSRRYFVFPVPVQKFAAIAAAAAIAGGALWLASWAATPLGDPARIVAGFLAFTTVYAILLAACGISVRALVSTPWEPLTTASSAGAPPAGINAR